MIHVIEVKSGEYETSSIEICNSEYNGNGVNLVTENLGTDIAFTLYDVKQKKTMLARQVPIEQIKDLVTDFANLNHERNELAFLDLNIVGGQTEEQRPYYKQLVQQFVDLVGENSELKKEKIFDHNVLKMYGRNNKIVVTLQTCSVIDRPHSESIGISVNSGKCFSYNQVFKNKVQKINTMYEEGVLPIDSSKHAKKFSPYNSMQDRLSRLSTKDKSKFSLQKDK